MLGKRWQVERGEGRKEEEKRVWTGVNLDYLIKFEAVSFSVETQRQIFFPQISVTMRLFIFLIFCILHAWFFYLFKNDPIFLGGRVLTVLSHAVHSFSDNKKCGALHSGVTEMAEEQSVSQQMWSWALMWAKTIPPKHLVLLVAVMKNHCHRGCHSSWIRGFRCHTVRPLSEKGYSALSGNRSVLQLGYSKYLQNYSQLLKILSILIIHFPLKTFITYM